MVRPSSAAKAPASHSEAIRTESIASAALCAGVAETQGRRPTHEDAHSLDCAEGWGQFWLLDGHRGDEASTFGSKAITNEFHKAIVGGKLPSNARIQQGFRTVDNSLKKHLRSLPPKKISSGAANAGSTVVGALVAQKEDGTFHVKLANCGDSRGLIIKDPDEECESSPVLLATADHKPNKSREQRRIEAAGGTVTGNRVPRVDGRIAVSRAIGDFDLKADKRLKPSDQKVTCDPDVYEIADVPSGSLLVLACDGVWEVMTSKSVAKKVREQLHSNPAADLKDVAASIVSHSYKKGSSDNLTVMIVRLMGANPLYMSSCGSMESSGCDSTTASEVCTTPSTPTGSPLPSPSEPSTPVSSPPSTPKASLSVSSSPVASRSASPSPSPPLLSVAPALPTLPLSPTSSSKNSPRSVVLSGDDKSLKSRVPPLPLATLASTSKPLQLPITARPSEVLADVQYPLVLPAQIPNSILSSQEASPPLPLPSQADSTVESDLDKQSASQLADSKSSALDLIPPEKGSPPLSVPINSGDSAPQDRPPGLHHLMSHGRPPDEVGGRAAKSQTKWSPRDSLSNIPSPPDSPSQRSISPRPRPPSLFSTPSAQYLDPFHVLKLDAMVVSEAKGEVPQGASPGAAIRTAAINQVARLNEATAIPEKATQQSL
eukprot:CAMPEP_0206561254 /NCGR_PEP_ID=MMETSP0325_2-20121206/21505_1 /ASSEMBLY_ACC=CAM_ASM_000347 /TAXON_ID=2866 /ORGANISM="Crypthecodinium cohnii, Strain Seligo" /LENGTH=658 /DNA_ID=CAMNT_0054063161 /DNA_START=33 /DNA_END=2009 /DNA_ORIENTATION=-